MNMNNNGIIAVAGRGNIQIIPEVTCLETCVQGVFPTYEAAYKQMVSI